MTGANTERVHVPDHQVAASILLGLASPLFIRACKGCTSEPYPGEELFEAWYLLRTIAQEFSTKASMDLPPARREGMIAALKVCHMLAHDYEISVPSVERCQCLTAERLTHLALLMAAQEAGVKNA